MLITTPLPPHDVINWQMCWLPCGEGQKNLLIQISVHSISAYHLEPITEQRTSKRETPQSRHICSSGVLVTAPKLEKYFTQKNTQRVSNSVMTISVRTLQNPCRWSTLPHRLALIVPGSMSSIFKRRRDSAGFAAEASVCQSGRERFFCDTHYKRLSGSTSKGEAACMDRSVKCDTAFHGQI